MNKLTLIKRILMSLNLEVLICSLLLCGSVYAEQSYSPLQVLQPGKDFEEGCGCSVYSRQNNALIFGDLDSKSPVVIKLHGKLLKLKCDLNNEPEKAKKGDTFSKMYSNGTVTLRLQYKTTSTCAPGDDSCEVVRYSVEGEFLEGNQKIKLGGLEGDCGC